MIKMIKASLLPFILVFGNVALANEQFVKNYFDNFISIQADFDQVVTQQKKKENSSGNLKIRKKTKLYLTPGFYFDYTKPFKQKIISDGAKLWHYDIDLQQVVIKKLAEFEKNSPLFIIFNDQPITDQFDIKTVSSERKYRLIPKKRSADTNDLEYIEIEFTKGQLSGVSAKQSSGSDLSLKFSNIVPNAAFPNDAFALTIPKGVDVIDETK